MATMATLMLTMATTTARDLLMLSPRLMLTMATMDMDWPTTDMDMDWLIMATTVLMLTLMPPMATTTARGLLMLSPRLMPTTATTTAMDWPTTGTDTLTMATTVTLMLTVATTDIITKLLLFCSRI